jgi:hypothetical protein
MTDKQLRELAAKAHGDLRYVNDGETWRHVLPSGLPGAWWNPLTDDGDAFRLSVRLGLSVEHRVDTVIVESFAGNIIKTEQRIRDPYAATRRAIINCAAAIGTAKGSA